MFPAVARAKSLFEFNISYPTLEERVAAYDPHLGRKPKFLESFPVDAASLIVETLEEIVDENSP
jgi:hypothetical protein